MIATNPTETAGADIVAFDSAGNVAALVEVKAVERVERHDFAALSGKRDLASRSIPFLIFVDRSRISIFGFVDGPSDNAAPAVELRTLDVLKHYDPGVAEREVFHDYLVVLIESWIRDIAFGWKSAHPPGLDELEPTGLPSRLRGGNTEAEASGSISSSSRDLSSSREER